MLVLGAAQDTTPNINSVLTEYGLQMETGYVEDSSRCYQGHPYAVIPEVSASGTLATGLKSDSVLMYASMDKITGLTMGADDYIPKPFNPLELVARVKAQIRRCTQYNDGSKSVGEVIDFGGLVLNRDSHECVFNERELTLTPIEFNILWILCENRGKVISSEELFERVWEEKYYKNSNNTVMSQLM